jgi:hypothetical protein
MVRDEADLNEVRDRDLSPRVAFNNLLAWR